MRGYVDPQGHHWDVVIGRESFGTLYAIFVGAAGNASPPRQTMLGAESTAAAHGELGALSDADLNELFERSTPKELG